MFTSIMIACSLSGSGECFSISHKAVFSTLEACQSTAYSAQAYAEINNLEIIRLTCYDWGVEA